MKTKLVSLCLGLLLLAAACGNGDGAATGDDALQTPDVQPAAQGMVNRPADGRYIYNMRGQILVPENGAASQPGARSTSQVFQVNDETFISEQTTEGQTVFTNRLRFEDDRIAWLGLRVESPQGELFCDFEPPLDLLHLPIGEQDLGSQEFAGEGAACDGTLQLRVEGTEEVEDAQGIRWSTWRIVRTTETRQAGSVTVATETRWFSPDLGMDIRTEGMTEIRDGEGNVVTRAESFQLLRDYPSPSDLLED